MQRVVQYLDPAPASLSTLSNGDLPDGPTCLARTTVNAAKKQVQIKIETFDFTPLTKTK